MKKVLFFVLALGFVASMSSCKRDWACVCTVDGVEYPSGTFKATKKDAKAACENLQVTSSVSCKIEKK